MGKKLLKLWYGLMIHLQLGKHPSPSARLVDVCRFPWAHAACCRALLWYFWGPGGWYVEMCGLDISIIERWSTKNVSKYQIHLCVFVPLFSCFIHPFNHMFTWPTKAYLVFVSGSLSILCTHKYIKYKTLTIQKMWGTCAQCTRGTLDRSSTKSYL